MYQNFGCSGFREWFCYHAVKACRWSFELVANVIFALVLRFQKRQSLPDITDPILLDSAVTLAEKIRNREVSCEAVVQAYIRRIKAVNGLLRCISDTSRFERAVQAAKEVDDTLSQPGIDLQKLQRDQPFLGVPFTVKEPVKLKGCASTVGLYLLKDQTAERSGEAVLALMDAGAIPLATSSIPEMCAWWETNNAITGLCRNPHDTRYSAGGSSGGEGSAIAACASPMGLGSDLGGSIRIPSLFNGVCGHKPSPGLVSSVGHSPELVGEMGEFFVIGPMARYAEDLREMFKVLTKRSAQRLEPKLEQHVDLKKLRFFFFESTGDPAVHATDANMKETLRKVVEHLELCYGVNVREAKFENLRYAYAIWAHKIAKNTIGNEDLILKNFLGDQQGKVNWLAEWCKLFAGKSFHTYPMLFHACLQNAMFRNVDSAFGKFLDRKCDALQKEMDELLGEDCVLLCPSFPHAALPHRKSYFYCASHGHTGFVNILKLPATHIPVGVSKDGLPLGITIIAGRNRDALTVGVACALEKGLGCYFPPCAVALTGEARCFSAETNCVVRRNDAPR